MNRNISTITESGEEHVIIASTEYTSDGMTTSAGNSPLSPIFGTPQSVYQTAAAKVTEYLLARIDEELNKWKARRSGC